MNNQINYDGGYNRIGKIEVVLDTCEVCRVENTLVLYCDSSEEEYCPTTICKPCIDKLFSNSEVV